MTPDCLVYVTAFAVRRGIGFCAGARKGLGCSVPRVRTVPHEICAYAKLSRMACAEGCKVRAEEKHGVQLSRKGALGQGLGRDGEASGATTPIEMMYLSASSTLISSSTTESLAIIRKKPEVGFGVVGT